RIRGRFFAMSRQDSHGHRHSRCERFRKAMVMLANIGLLVSIAWPLVGVPVARHKRYKQRVVVMHEAARLREAALSYGKTHNGQCPTRLEQLVSGRIVPELRKDPWGQSYLLKCDNGEVQIISMGPDRLLGTPDDIRTDPEL